MHGSTSSFKRRAALRWRRGGSLLWAVAALAIAAAMTPLYVSACHSLSRLTARGGHRLIATQRGTAELDRVREAGTSVRDRQFPVTELPSGRGTVRVRPGASERLREVAVEITWLEHGATARAEWTTLVGR
jgi:hypothetical protein